MIDHEKTILIKKVLQTTATLNERKIVEDWFVKTLKKGVVWQMDNPDEEQALEKDMHTYFLRHISPV